ncbi:MAG: hypothetical protein L0H25_01945 [Micrococcales bacterium]|nr:hypothetical protein [Micrococcales bacterium]
MAVIIGVLGWVIAISIGRGAPASAPTVVAPRLDLPGRVIVLDTTSGRLGAARPDGSGFAPFSGPGFPAKTQAKTAVVSPDGGHVIVGDTQVVDLEPGGEHVRAKPLTAGDAFVGPQPFADHETRAVFATSPGTGRGRMMSVDLDGGSRHDLGPADGAAIGDPRRDGAIVAVEGKTEVNIGRYTERNTSRVELRAWHRPSTRLAATAGLLKEAGLPSGPTYVIGPTVSPDGSLVALSIDELTPNVNSVTAKHALVVTDRSGRAIASRASFTSARPAWSRDGAQLAYLDDQGVVLLRISGARATTSSIPAQVSGQPCLFSPAGGHLLCDDRVTQERFIVTLADGRVDRLPLDPAHLAVAWLPARGGAG